MLAAIAVALLVVGLASAPAGAHKKVFGGTLSLALRHGSTPAQDAAAFSIGDTRLICFRNRLVNLFQVDKTGAKQIGSARSDLIGNGSITIPGAIKTGDSFYAVAPRKVAKRRKGHRHICKKLVSPVVVG